MVTSPTLTTNYLAEPNPRQHALTNLLPTLFPHSPNTSEEKMEEKVMSTKISKSSDSNSKQCLFSSSGTLKNEAGIQPASFPLES
jgi:hypothetical protein